MTAYPYQATAQVGDVINPSFPAMAGASQPEQPQPEQGAAPSPDSQEAPQQYQPQQTPQQQPQPSTPQELDDAGKQWWGSFEQYTGLSRDEFIQGIGSVKEIQTAYAQQQYDAQLNELRGSWGQQFDQNLAAVQEYAKNLPPDMYNSLNNPKGAQLIFAQIQQEQAAKRPQVPQAQVPQFDRSRQQQPVNPVNTQNQPMFTQQQILSMSPQEYQQRQQEIMYAYQNGLVVQG